VQLQQWSEQHCFGTLVSQITALTPVLSLLPHLHLRLQERPEMVRLTHTWNHVARIGRRPEARHAVANSSGGQVRLCSKTPTAVSAFWARSVLSTGGALGVFGTVPSGSAGVHLWT
jgi:hypothetical protein